MSEIIPGMLCLTPPAGAPAISSHDALLVDQLRLCDTANAVINSRVFWLFLGIAIPLVLEILIRRPRLEIYGGASGGGQIGVNLRNKPGWFGLSLQPRRWVPIAESWAWGWPFERARLVRCQARLIDKGTGETLTHGLIWRDPQTLEMLGYQVDISDGQQVQLLIFATEGDPPGATQFERYYVWDVDQTTGERFVPEESMRRTRPGSYEVQIRTEQGALLMRYRVRVIAEDGKLRPILD